MGDRAAECTSTANGRADAQTADARVATPLHDDTSTQNSNRDEGSSPLRTPRRPIDRPPLKPVVIARAWSAVPKRVEDDWIDALESFDPLLEVLRPDPAEECRFERFLVKAPAG